MPEIIVNIPEDKVEFFYQLLDEMGLEYSDDTIIPEEQRELVRSRMAKSQEDPSRLIPWDEAKDELRKKLG